MKSVGISDVGVKRNNNQDSIFTCDSEIGCLPNLYIVADGMGGYEGGELASRTAIDGFIDSIKNEKRPTIFESIKSGIARANDDINRKAEENANLSNMGTTFVVGTVIDGKLLAANIGDSRLYLYDGETAKLSQISVDHSLVEEMIERGELEREDARFHPRKNVITRALWAGDVSREPDCFEVPLKSGDMFLLCSDGLSNMMDDSDIEGILTLNGENIEKSKNELLKLAKNNGGFDNISIIIVRV